VILTLREKAAIQADPETVRAWLSDIENWPKINAKITSIAAEADRCVGELMFNGRKVEFAGIQERPDKDTFVCHIMFRDKQGKESRLDVTYSVKETRSGVVVTEEATFLEPIPMWAGLFIKFIARFGRSQGPTNLDNIAREVASRPEN